jgi:hypothetical protein
MPGLTITVDDREVSALLARIISPGTKRGAVMVAANAARNVIQDHFRALNAKPNKLKGAKTGFWADAADKTQAPKMEGDDTAVVSVRKKGVALRYFGGTIETSSPMTIPVIAAAHGHRAREFDLHFVWSAKGGRPRPYGLANKSGILYYILSRFATHPDDPDVMPTDTAMMEAAVGAARGYLQRMAERQGGERTEYS